MPNVFDVEVYKAEDVKMIAKKIESLDGIEKADYGGASIENLISVFEIVRNGAMAVIAALGVLTLFLITHTIRMSIYTRMNEISIMRNVGAENWYIRMPFVFEGMMIGFIGSMIPGSNMHCCIQFDFSNVKWLFCIRYVCIKTSCFCLWYWWNIAFSRNIGRNVWEFFGSK